jgi:hypothetical protein
MSIEDYHPAKLFTPESANAMLPLVRAITADVVVLAREMVDRRQRLDYLTSGRNVEEGDPYGAELAQMEEEQEKDTARLQEYVDELHQLGVEPKTLTEGLIDFPSMMDGRIVYLCWKYGEPEVQHWHELDAGFAGRQPLVVAVGDDGSDRSM